MFLRFRTARLTSETQQRSSWCRVGPAHDICGEFARACARAFQVMAADRKALIGDGGTAQRASHARFPAAHTSVDRRARLCASAAGEFYRRHEASWAARTSVVDRTWIGSRHNTSVPRSAYDYHQPGERRAHRVCTIVPLAVASAQI